MHRCKEELNKELDKREEIVRTEAKAFKEKAHQKEKEFKQIREHRKAKNDATIAEVKEKMLC